MNPYPSEEATDPAADPGRRRNPRWWLAPALLTILAVPASCALVFVLGFGAMIFDPCQPGGCPVSERNYRAAWILGGCSVLPVVAGWLFPRRRGADFARWLMFALYVLLWLTPIVVLLTTEPGT